MAGYARRAVREYFCANLSRFENITSIVASADSAHFFDDSVKLRFCVWFVCPCCCCCRHSRRVNTAQTKHAALCAAGKKSFFLNGTHNITFLSET